MDKTTIHASDDAMDASQSLARRRHRLSQAKVRSITQRRGQNDKGHLIGPSDEFDRQPIDVRDCRFELLSGIAAIGEHPGKGDVRIAGPLDHPSRWSTEMSIAAKIGCVPQTLHEWVKKAEATERLAKAGIEPSVGSVGDIYNCESMWAVWRV